MLKTIPEYAILADTLKAGRSAAVTGVGQINRSHMIAGLSKDLQKPFAIVCQDDMTARRIQEELKCFLGLTAPILPGRDLTFYDAAVASKTWEQKRLRQLRDWSSGAVPIQILTWESLSLRTMPWDVLQKASFTLEVGQEYSLDDLASRLTAAGYSRCGMVEGPGQFAFRGGIADIFSPGEDRPVRLEFFGDELDTMGYFDPDTQRRSDNVDKIQILPVSEALPGMHPKGIAGMEKDLQTLISRQRRRKHPNELLIETLTKDLEKLQNGLHNSAWDRYLALMYPEMACAADFAPKDCIWVLCDHANLSRAARTRTDEMGLQLDSLLNGGQVAGELCDFVIQWEDFTKRLRGKSTAYFDTFGGSAYPEENPPSQLLPVTAKQLPSYGGNLDAAVSDMSHYQKMQFGTLVLCGTRHRAELMQQMLREKGLSAFLAIPLSTLPKPEQILLTDGTLPYGMEYPLSKLAVLTEGQLIAKTAPRQRHRPPRNPPPTGRS